MSHFTTVKTRIRDRELLILALEDLGTPWDDKPVRGYQGTRVSTDIRAVFEGHYDVGFRLHDDHYEAVGDFSMLGREAQDFLQRLTQRYAYHTTFRTLAGQGFEVIEESQEDGNLHLLMRRMA